MIFKRSSFYRKKPELRNICEQKMLKSNFFSKNKNFRNVLFEYIYRRWLFHSYYITINSQSVGRPDKRRSSHWRCSEKKQKVFLKIQQISQENACVGVCF